MEPFSYTSETASSTGESAPPWSAVLNESENGPGLGGVASRSAPSSSTASELTVMTEAGGASSIFAYLPPLAGGPR